MKLQTKFVILGGIATLFVVVQVGLNYVNAKKVEQALRVSNVIGEVIQRHMDGDMKHDAIHSDVLTALIAFEHGDTAGANEAVKALQEDGAAFQKDFEDNQKEELPEDIMAAYKESMAPLANYVAAANKLLAAARGGQDIAAANADFVAKFEAMEQSNEILSELLLKWNDVEETTGKKLLADNAKYSAILGLISVISVLALPILSMFTIFRPLRVLIDQMGELAQGRYNVKVVGAQRVDEIGEIARAVEIFKENGEQRVALEKQQETARAAARVEEERQLGRVRLTDAFASRMQGIIENVAAAATELYQTSEAMGYSISSTSTRIGAVAAASTQTAQNVQSVAAAAEELTATVREIAEQIARSSSTVQQAVSEVSKADDTAVQLDEATAKIGQIVDVIQSIASQINLLALNATIESARAGEAGKGFAVVAGEVKILATQTSKATDEIAGTIGSIQAVSKQVIESLQAIKGAIAGVEQISSAISAAVEEQNATTNEIASNMGTASSGTTRITDEIQVVSAATAESSNSAGQVLDAAKMLSQEAGKLSKEVSEFISDMAA